MKLGQLSEAAIYTQDLAAAKKFYRDVLGLEVGLRDEKRPWVFLRVGGREGMVVLQEQSEEFPQQHFAFAVTEADIDQAAQQLKVKGIAAFGPIVHEWIPAKSLYFADPDGHDLELCAPLA